MFSFIKHSTVPFVFVSVFTIWISSCSSPSKPTESMDPGIKELIGKMTLEEKLGQLTLSVAGVVTGPAAFPVEPENFKENIRNGLVGGYFNTYGAKFTRELQQTAVEESRLGIPLLFGADVIHGFRTVFPIPLGESASWDLEIIKNSARITAKEATAVGITWNFVPMVDISRDARWGRVAEGAGEDPYLGSQIAKARIRGLQGNDLSDPESMAACTKHWAAYGAPDGGRDYNTVDISERLLRDIYLPPYKATVEAGAATFMTSFNELNGVPATGNEYLIEQILRKEWGFTGMVVSDYNSIGELVAHGVAADDAEAGLLSLKAGTDMDMEGYIYQKQLPKLLEEGKVDMALVDQAVARILKLKLDLGLFDDPYKYCDEERERNELLSEEHLEAALNAAKKSIVLLKNENDIVPISKDISSIALIGPLADNKLDMNGTWSFFGRPEDPVTILAGIQSKVGDKTKINYAVGCNLYDNSEEHFSEAIKAAQKSEVIVLAIGESAIMNWRRSFPFQYRSTRNSE